MKSDTGIKEMLRRRKRIIIVAAAFAFAVVWCAFQACRSEQGDNTANIAVVSSRCCPDYEIEALSDFFNSILSPETVKIRVYNIELGALNQDRSEIGALDADLLSGSSVFFLVEEPQIFSEVTNGICRPAVPLKNLKSVCAEAFDDFSITMRNDAEDKYAEIWDSLIQ